MCVCSYDRGTTYNVFVGQKKLIAGMDKALVGMCVNERWMIKIPPQLAYGKEGYGKHTFKSQFSVYHFMHECSYLSFRCLSV